MRKSGFLLFLLLLFSIKADASYCYSGITSYKVIAEDSKLFLRTTVKDGNRISYISDETVMVADDIDLSGFEIVGEIEDGIVFSTDKAYYILTKN